MVLPEIELPVGSLVITDLHLDVEVDGACDRFLRWLEESQGAPRLLILGDLFEFWIGSAQAESAGGQAVIEALRQRTAAGTPIDIIPGNRDFLLGSGFEAATGCRIHHEGLIGKLGGEGERVLFIHGDELCTLDRSYQRLRRVLHAAPVRFLASHLPGGVTRAVARRLRRASRQAVSGKDPAAMAQQPDECLSRATQQQATVVVCGHAHVFRHEDLGDVRWMVLDAFGGKRDTLEVISGPKMRVRGAG